MESLSCCDTHLMHITHHSPTTTACRACLALLSSCLASPHTQERLQSTTAIQVNGCWKEDDQTTALQAYILSSLCTLSAKSHPAHQHQENCSTSNPPCQVTPKRLVLVSSTSVSLTVCGAAGVAVTVLGLGTAGTSAADAAVPSVAGAAVPSAAGVAVSSAGRGSASAGAVVSAAVGVVIGAALLVTLAERAGTVDPVGMVLVGMATSPVEAGATLLVEAGATLLVEAGAALLAAAGELGTFAGAFPKLVILKLPSAKVPLPHLPLQHGSAIDKGQFTPQPSSVYGACGLIGSIAHCSLQLRSAAPW